MAIATEMRRFESYRGMGDDYDYEVPIVQPGDRVELSGWANPMMGTVLESNQKLVSCDAPVAVPGGGPYVCGLHSIKKLWRGEDVWVAKD